MLIFKKLFFAPFFILSFAALIFTFSPILKSYEFIFSLSMDTLIQLITLVALFSLTSLVFILLATMAMDWKIVAPIGLVTAASSMLILPSAQGLMLSVGSLAAFIVTFAALEGKLKSYLTFDSSSLLGPSVRSLTSFLILVFSVIYFLSANQMIQKQGFQIPDSLIDATLQFVQPQTSTDQEQSSLPQLSIPQEQLDLLKQNPELLKQSGLDPKILDTLNQPQTSSKTTPQDLSNDLIKTAVKDQIQNFIKPYMNFIPAILAILLFFTLQSLSSIINLLIYPLLWLIFFILEKVGFIKFTMEQRPVKKMVV